MAGERQASALDDLDSVSVSRPVRFGRPARDGAWSEWCAARLSGVPVGVDWSDPGLVVDLTGPVARVIPPPTRNVAPTWVDDREPEVRSTVPANLVTVAAVAIVVLNLLDIVTTKLALAQGATEGNPLASLFVHHLPIFVGIKVLLPGLVAFRMWVTRYRTTPMLLSAMWWVVGVYSMVIVINGLHLL